MGRRALPKFDRSVSLDEHFLELEQVESPFALQTYYPETGPLEIEIGSGKGLFLRNEAARQPERCFLGVEVSKKYAQYAAHHVAKQGSPNVKFMYGDALRFVRDYVVDHSVAAVHVYFPDPWWKGRHRRRRVMNEAFIQDIQRVLQIDGVLHFWTDVEEYYQSTCQLITTCSSLHGPIAVPEKQAEHSMDYRTHFERRMRLHGHPIYRAQFHVPKPPASTK